MSYIYHRVPAHMTGTTLYPLNSLKVIDADLYNLYREGYRGREKLLKRKIPQLDCLWNDVLHCSPVHPQKIMDALHQHGIKNNTFPIEFYIIDPAKDIDIARTVIFYRTGDSAISFEPASHDLIQELDVVPALTQKYYASLAGTDEDVFPYQFVPHVLYKGTIDTRSLKVLTIT